MSLTIRLFDIVMSELDTITDFTNYLSKKEQLFRRGNLAGASGEEDLVAFYATHTDSTDQHEFTRPDNTPLGPNDRMLLDDGQYAHLLQNQQYLDKKKADEVSYVWDNLINTFTEPLLDGTNLVPDGFPREVSDLEEGLRHMALVPRFMRRGFSEAILGALEMGSTTDRMLRAFLPGPSEIDRETGFFLHYTKGSIFCVRLRPLSPSQMEIPAYNSTDTFA